MELEMWQIKQTLIAVSFIVVPMLVILALSIWSGRASARERERAELEALRSFDEAEGWSGRIPWPVLQHLVNNQEIDLALKRTKAGLERIGAEADCNHIWAPPYDSMEGLTGDQPYFRVNRAMSEEPIAHVQCKLCDCRTWFTQEQWDEMEKST